MVRAHGTKTRRLKSMATGSWRRNYYTNIATGTGLNHNDRLADRYTWDTDKYSLKVQEAAGGVSVELKFGPTVPNDRSLRVKLVGHYTGTGTVKLQAFNNKYAVWADVPKLTSDAPITLTASPTENDADEEFNGRLDLGSEVDWFNGGGTQAVLLRLHNTDETGSTDYYLSINELTITRKSRRIWNERFEEPSGTDESWDNSVVDTGCTLDPDVDTSLVAGANTDWLNLCCECTIDDVGEDAYYQEDFGGGYHRAELHIEFNAPRLNMFASGGDFIVLVYVWDSAWEQCFQLRIRHDGSDPRFWFRARPNLANQDSYGPVVKEETTYKIDVKWDMVAKEWNWRVNNHVYDSGTLTSSNGPIDHCQFGIASQAGNVAFSTYMDNIQVTGIQTTTTTTTTTTTSTTTTT
jgi:hypothetical protein